MINNYTLVIEGRKGAINPLLTIEQARELYVEQCGSISTMFKRVVEGEKSIILHLGTSITCRETLVNHMVSVAHRASVFTEAGYNPYVSISCGGDLDGLSGKTIKELPASQKSLLNHALSTMVGGDVSISIDGDFNKPIVKFFWPQFTSPIKVSAALLIIRLFGRMVEIDNSTAFLYNTLHFARFLVANCEKISDSAGNSSSYGVDLSSLLRFAVFLAYSGPIPSTRWNVGGVNGPSSYVYNYYTFDDFKTAYMNLGYENIELFDAVDMSSTRNSYTALKALKMKKMMNKEKK